MAANWPRKWSDFLSLPTAESLSLFPPSSCSASAPPICHFPLPDSALVGKEPHAKATANPRKSQGEEAYRLHQNLLLPLKTRRRAPPFIEGGRVPGQQY